MCVTYKVCFFCLLTKKMNSLYPLYESMPCSTSITGKTGQPCKGPEHKEVFGANEPMPAWSTGNVDEEAH